MDASEINFIGKLSALLLLTTHHPFRVVVADVVEMPPLASIHPIVFCLNSMCFLGHRSNRVSHRSGQRKLFYFLSVHHRLLSSSIYYTTVFPFRKIYYGEEPIM